MRDALSQPLQQPTLTFSDFLTRLLQTLAAERIRFCILRNYENFPNSNIGNDIDFLIAKSDLWRTIHAIQNIGGIRIIGCVERPSVVMLYLEGISPEQNLRTMEVDLDLGLDWKGLPFLATETVLQAAIPRSAGEAVFFVPSPVHEAIISLFASLLVGGWLKERYFPKVQRAFAADRLAVIDAMQPHFGTRAATRLADAVIQGDRSKVLGCVRSLRASLALRSVLYKPFSSILEVFKHYAEEVVVRHSSKTLETVCILTPGSETKSAIINALMPMLRTSAGEVQRRSFIQGPPTEELQLRIGLDASADSGSAGSSTVSVAKVIQSIVKEWVGRLKGRKSLTLQIWETRWGGLVTARKHQHRSKVDFLQWIALLMPSPDLWILLREPRDEERFESAQSLPSGDGMGLQACQSFVKTRKNFVILDAGRPVSEVTEAAYAAIIEALSERVQRQLARRFPQWESTN
jgi:hypothetical protein